MKRHTEYRRQHSGFTLVEVLIVIVILGILASIVLPRMGQFDNDAKESALSHDLQSLRRQITLYSFHHDGRFPGEGSTSPQDFKDALILSSDKTGNTGAVGTLPLGPYIIGRFPANPYSGATGVLFSTDVPGEVPNESATVGGELVGWIYNPATGRIKGNNQGFTTRGAPLSEL